jgi:hypothetical protein
MLKKIGLVFITLVMAAALVAVGCKGKRKVTEGDDNKDATAKPQYASKGDEGTITGKVVFDGAAPDIESAQ